MFSFKKVDSWKVITTFSSEHSFSSNQISQTGPLLQQSLNESLIIVDCATLDISFWINSTNTLLWNCGYSLVHVIGHLGKR